MYFQLSSLDLTQIIFSSKFISSDCVILFSAYTSNTVGKKVQLLQTLGEESLLRKLRTCQPCLFNRQSYYTALGLLLEPILSVFHVSPVDDLIFQLQNLPGLSPVPESVIREWVLCRFCFISETTMTIFEQITVRCSGSVLNNDCPIYNPSNTVLLLCISLLIPKLQL